MQIVDICLATRPHNGGLINLEELCRLLNQRRKSAREAVTEDDCLRAISKLKVLFLKICDVYYDIPWIHTPIQLTLTATPLFFIWVLAGRDPCLGCPSPTTSLVAHLLS